MVDAQEIYNGTQRAVFIPYRVLLLTTKQGYQGRRKAVLPLLV